MDSGKKLVLVTGDLSIASYIDETVADGRVFVSSDSVHKRILQHCWTSDMVCIGTYSGGDSIEATELYNKLRYIQTSNSDGNLLNLLGTIPFSDSINQNHPPSSQDLDSYLNVMSTLVEKILESTSEDALILITDHRLSLLPNILKRKRKTQKVGILLFHHFPHYELFKNSCIKEEVLLGILGADLVSFVSYENAYHFVDACAQILGYNHTCIDGSLFLDCEGRQVLIRTIPITIDSTLFPAILAKEDVMGKVNQLKNKYLGKKVILAVDEIESFKGIQLQFMVVEYLLGQKKEVVFIQLIRSSSKSGDILKKNKVKTICDTINIKFGVGSYCPVVVEFVEDMEASRVPYYAISDCLINLCLTDLVYQIGYEYLTCKQNSGHLLMSEFLSCSASLKGVIRVNPRKTKEVAKALSTLLFQGADKISQTDLPENQTYIRNNDINVWPKKIFNDLHEKCKSYAEEQLVSMGDGLKHGLILHHEKVEKLNINDFKQSYISSSRKGVIFIDFDQFDTEFDTDFDTEFYVKSMVAFEKMCNAKYVFLFTKVSSQQAEKVFGNYPSLTICAENGFCFRLSQTNEWEQLQQPEWKVGATAIMEKFCENVEGLIIETIGPEISCNFRGLPSHLRTCYEDSMMHELKNATVDTITTCYSLDDVVYVGAKGISKAATAQALLERVVQEPGIDFGLCIGFGNIEKPLVDLFATIPLIAEANHQFFTYVVTIAPNMKTESGYYLNNWREFFEILADIYVGESSFSGLAENPEEA